jgi:magnesium and cobalt transporter
VIGILLAKDLLRLHAGEDVAVRDMLRPAIFIPDSKRLNVLLREFRASRNHMAIVVDEYGGVAGLVTIEDVLEQIVGDIEDEYDFDEAADNILLDQAGRYRVKAATEIEDFNAAFGTDFSDEEFDTVGGMVIHRLGRLPKRGEVVQIEGLRIQVLRADSRRVHTLLTVSRSPADPGRPGLVVARRHAARRRPAGLRLRPAGCFSPASPGSMSACMSSAACRRRSPPWRPACSAACWRCFRPSPATSSDGCAGVAC